jgi:hypothetical protein
MFSSCDMSLREPPYAKIPNVPSPGVVTPTGVSLLGTLDRIHMN